MEAATEIAVQMAKLHDAGESLIEFVCFDDDTHRAYSKGDRFVSRRSKDRQPQTDKNEHPYALRSANGYALRRRATAYLSAKGVPFARR